MAKKRKVSRAKLRRPRHSATRSTPRRNGQNKRPIRARAASTSDVIGVPPPPVRVPRKWRQHYQRLVGLHSLILQRKDNMTQAAQEEKPNYSLHMADAGTDNYDQDFALSMISSEQDSLYEIEQAIERIKDDAYGICELTGKPIEAARLEAIPWARFSAGAEKQLEREGTVARTRLGQREEIAKTEALAETVEEEEEEV